MKDIPEFRIDRWIQAQIDNIKIPLQGSNIGAWTLSELQQLDPSTPILDHDLPLTYGTSAGSLHLRSRSRIAALYSSPENGVPLTADNVVVTPGSIMANYLALSTLVGPGDHVICMYPTFSQLFAVPRFQGAEVSLWRLRKRPDGSGWFADVDDLRSMLRENTRVIIINNPNNPTGAILPLPLLTSLLTLTTSRPNLTLYSDEVFHPLFHTPGPHPPSVLSLPRPTTSTTNPGPGIIVTGSVSKTLGLPGLRLGWIASPSVSFLRERVMKARDYTTISVSQLSDAVGAFALSPVVMERVLERSHGVCKRSVEIIGEWVGRNRGRVEWMRPEGGGAALMRVRGRDGGWVDDEGWVREVVRGTGVGVVPAGYCFGDDGMGGGDGEWRGYVRISLGKEEGVLREGLRGLERVLGEV